MADTMQFDLVSPERLLASVQATEVQIPGSEGDMTAMAGHAPTITTLRPGIVRVVTNEGAQEFFAIGGFAEINADGISVLAEVAAPRNEVTQEMFDRIMEEASKARAEAQPEELDAAEKLIAELGVMADLLGLTARP